MSKANKKGFTLIEMLIVVTIIGILAAIIMPRFLTSSDTAKKNSHKTTRQNINAQIELYHFNTNIWPADFAAASWGATPTDYFPDGQPVSCNADVAVAWTIDATSHRIDTSTHTGHE